MPPRVRQTPLMERIKSALNVMDFLLWLSEELETRDWDSKSFAVKMGVFLNFIFMLARANAQETTDAEDELFGDGEGTSWVPLIMRPLIWLLILFAFTNAFWAMTRVRNYRLFEGDIDRRPETPSARRVRVQSAPSSSSSSPMRLLSDIMTSETAESRAHPDANRDVWEVSVWDPLPMSMAFFCVFGPGHVLIHIMFLPVAHLDPRPSMTVFNCIVLQVMVSCQLWLLQGQFSQQGKDAALIQKETMHEYDKKYVHPNLHSVMREAGIQVNMTSKGELKEDMVETGTPAIYLRRTFQPRPNPNYIHHLDPDTPQPISAARRTYTSTGLNTPQPRYTPASDHRRSGSALRHGLAATTPPPPQSSSRNMTGTGPATNFGGSLGVYTHAKSPLKKTAATGMANLSGSSPRVWNSRDMAQLEQDEDYGDQVRRQGSPVKETRRLTGNPFQRRNRYSDERYPSRFG